LNGSLIVIEALRSSTRRSHAGENRVDVVEGVADDLMRRGLDPDGDERTLFIIRSIIGLDVFTLSFLLGRPAAPLLFLLVREQARRVMPRAQHVAVGVLFLCPARQSPL
jgi:hypothetical protein